MTGPYDDIIGLDRPISMKHPPMSLQARAAQFSPFAALTGYEAVLSETARLTDTRIELDEDAKAALDQRLRLALRLGDGLPLRLTWFQADPRKEGGCYRQTEGTVRRVDELARTLVLTDGTRIPIDDIFALDHPLFPKVWEDGALWPGDGEEHTE